MAGGDNNMFQASRGAMSLTTPRVSATLRRVSACRRRPRVETASPSKERGSGSRGNSLCRTASSASGQQQASTNGCHRASRRSRGRVRVARGGVCPARPRESLTVLRPDLSSRQPRVPRHVDAPHNAAARSCATCPDYCTRLTCQPRCSTSGPCACLASLERRFCAHGECTKARALHSQTRPTARTCTQAHNEAPVLALSARGVPGARSSGARCLSPFVWNGARCAAVASSRTQLGMLSRTCKAQ